MRTAKRSTYFGELMIEQEQNWAGNYSYGAARLHRPATVEQIRELVASCSKLRALGTRHSFNDIADTSGDLVSTERLDRVIALDPERRTVTVQAGIRYGHLARYLHRHGYALANMASLPHISVAGACATATHGSGDRNGNLATAVAAMRLVKADGELVVLSREQHAEQFAGAVVGLGGLGVITELTLDLVPTFDARQLAYLNLPFAQLGEHFDQITASAYSISLFADWRSPRFKLVLLKQPVAGGDTTPAAPTFFGATLAQTQQTPIDGLPLDRMTIQMGITGPWHERLPHFRIEFTPSSGEELQSEYFVPRHEAVAALDALGPLSGEIAPLLQICEVRTIAADRLWMSPCYQRPTVGIHFTWKKDWPGVRLLLPKIEAQLAPFDARPHWGKLFTMPPARLQTLYRRLPDFQELLRSFDPDGKFRNSFLDTYIFATPA